MAKKFTKLFLGDVVHTVGSKAFRKLSTESGGLPIWNGTDLTGTTWDVSSGWSATRGYGIFDVNFNAVVQGDELDSTQFAIGYSFSFDTGLSPRENRVSILPLYGWLSNSGGFTATFTGGTDATNTSLISWLKQYGQLTSHTMPSANLITFTIENWSYQAEGGMTWADWVNSSYNTDGYFISGTDVVANAGSKVAFNDVKVTSTEPIENGKAYGLYAEGFEW
ncbi:MAG: hypothetical protein J6V49_07515 [Bacteroidales bacterium]|nr:hypothetical protein [Bacteroidales bacterium]